MDLFKISRKLIEKYQFKVKLNNLRKSHEKALRTLKRKEKITIVFLVIHESVWKCERLYRLLQNDKRYDPVIVICPYIKYGEETMKRDMQKAYDNFVTRNYNTISAWDDENFRWIDIKETLGPDIVFFTNPWGLTRNEYLISNFMDTLTCYVPYGFKNSSLFASHYNMPTQNFVWKFFIETELHQKLAMQYARNKGVNTVVTGAPGMDSLIDVNYKARDVWKVKSKGLKRIIWAPHHTIPGPDEKHLNFSTFLEYHEIMFEIAEKYRNDIQVSFKPHPTLRPKLSLPEIWGKERTDLYYKRWVELENGQLDEGEYTDLFYTSDALIHDSVSFIIEYLYTTKPVMFLVKNEKVRDSLNEIGKLAFEVHYKGRIREEVESFITQTVLLGNDPAYNERKRVFDQTVRPPNNQTASENIYCFLNNVIK